LIWIKLICCNGNTPDLAVAPGANARSLTKIKGRAFRSG